MACINTAWEVPKTKHAAVRMKERGIPAMVIDWLLDYGLIENQGDTRLVYFNKQSKKQIKKYAGPRALSVFNSFEKAYAVLAANDDKVITTGYKTIKFKRKYNTDHQSKIRRRKQRANSI